MSEGVPIPKSSDNTRIREYLDDLELPLHREYFGRDQLFEQLDDCIKNGRYSVICIHGFIGEGKSSFLFHLVNRLAEKEKKYYGARFVYYWKFRSPNIDTKSGVSNISGFLEKVVNFYGIKSEQHDDSGRLEQLLTQLNKNKSILILDGIDAIQESTHNGKKVINDKIIKGLITSVARNGLVGEGILIILSRHPVIELDFFQKAINIPITQLTEDDCCQIFNLYNILGEKQQLKKISRNVKNNPLAVTLIARLILSSYEGNFDLFKPWTRLSDSYEDGTLESDILRDIMKSYDNSWKENSGELAILLLLSIYRHPVAFDELREIAKSADLLPEARESWKKISSVPVNNLKNFGLLIGDYIFDMQAVAREYFSNMFRTSYPDKYRLCNNLIATRKVQNFKDERVNSISDMEALYEAVYHFSEAEEYDKALEIYWERINRKRVFFSQKILGAYTNDLTAISCFFKDNKRWIPVENLQKEDQAWLCASCAYLLNSLGYLEESEVLRKNEISLHTELNCPLLVIQNMVNLSRTLLMQYKINESIEILEIAQREYNSYKDQSNSGKFAEGINPNDLGVSVLAHLAFTHFCRNQDDHRILEIIKEIPTGVPLTVTDSFSIALILLSNPDWKLICEEKIKLDTQSLMERLNRAKKSNKSHEIAYAYTLLGLSLFPHDIENAFNFMEKAINFAQVAYRMDQFPLIFLIYANMIMKLVPRNLRNTQRLKQILETLEKRFAWHEIPLYLSEYRMLRLEFLVEDFVSDKNFKMAEELDMLLRSNTLIEAHYFNRLEICKRKMVYFRNSY